MGCRGVHLALAEAEVTYLRSLPSDQDRLGYLLDDIVESYFADHEEFLAERDKAWNAMPRCLADGNLTWDGGECPLNHVVLAGKLLYSQSDYIMSPKSPEQVGDSSTALPAIIESEFRRRYFALDADA